MRSNQSSLNRAARPLVLSLIPVLTCSAASAQSLYPDGSAHYSNRIGSSGYAVPSYASRPAWQPAQTASGATTGFGRRAVWSPWQQSAVPYGSSAPAPNYGGRPAWRQAPVQYQYGTGTTGDYGRPAWQQGPVGSVNGSPNINNGDDGGSTRYPPRQQPIPTGTPGGSLGEAGHPIWHLKAAGWSCPYSAAPAATTQGGCRAFGPSGGRRSACRTAPTAATHGKPGSTRGKSATTRGKSAAAASASNATYYCGTRPARPKAGQ